MNNTTQIAQWKIWQSNKKDIAQRLFADQQIGLIQTKNKGFLLKKTPSITLNIL